MSNERDADRTVSVSDDEVRVEKAFARDEFPVPAITFRLTSEADEPAHVRLIDRIPEEFPMEGVGFHPDYESDNWTAYKDHRVEYERTLEPGESVTTVYGIRLEEASDVSEFLREPILERPPVQEAPEDRAADVDDILGTDRSQLVRDALQGRGRLVDQESSASDPAESAGLSEPAEPGTSPGDGPAEVAAPRDVDAELDPAVRENDDAVAPVAAGADGPRTIGSELTSVVRRNGDAVTPVSTDDDAADEVESEPESDPDDAADGDESEPGDRTVEDGDSETATDTDDETTTDTDDYVDMGGKTDADPPADATAPADGDSLAAALAAEIRAGNVSESDLDTLRGELDGGLPRSADVRIRRLQSQLADLGAYTDAMKEFIDAEGTGADLVERLDDELDAVAAELDGLREGLDAADADREALRGDVDDLSTELAATDDRLDDVDETAATAVAGVEELHERADGVRERVDDVESDLDDLAADLDDTDASVADVEADVGDLRDDVAAVDDEVDVVREDLSAEIDDLRAEVSSLSTKLDRIDAIEDDIEQLQTFRDRLNSAFGPGGDAGDE